MKDRESDSSKVTYYNLDYSPGKADDLDIVSAVTEARDRKAVERIEAEPTEIVRGGSVGSVIDGEDIHGICHRKSYLRFHGISPPLSKEIELMTSQGEKNEEIWLEDLRNSKLAENHIIKDQTEFECTWTLSNGAPGSGSPDIVIFDKRTGAPVKGLELKNISSVSKAVSAHYELRPTQDHIIQAANYSLRMGDMYNEGKPLPYELVYSSRSVWHFYNMSEKNKKKIIKRGWDINYVFGKPMTIQPFHRIFKLTWEKDGTLSYWTPGLERKVKTKLTRETIDAYYEAIAFGIEEHDHLGPRPSAKHIDGKSAYSPCGFCDFKEVCDMNESMKPAEFKDHARVIVGKLWETRGKKNLTK